MNRISFKKIKAEKTLSLSDHPRYVQVKMTLNFATLFILIAITISALITFKNLEIFIAAFCITAIHSLINLHLYYILTRDKALILKGVCIDIREIKAPLVFKTKFMAKILIKSDDAENNNTYIIPYKLKYMCNTGDRVELYTMKNSIYIDMNDNIVISAPLFIKFFRT